MTLKIDNDKDRLNVLINLLRTEIDSYLPWLFRREAAAWAALVIYLAILSSLLNSMIDIQLFNLYIKSFIISLFIIFI